MAWCGRAGATTYYVSTTGDDGNAGTDPTKPLKTIQHGVDLSAAGDVVDVRAGTYAETVHFLKSGSAGAPITVRAHAGERPLITPGPTGFGFLFEAEPWRDRLEIGWLAVDGFEISTAEVGVELTNAHDISITRCDVHDNTTQGILGEGHDVFIAKNVVHDNGDTTTNLDHGMYLTGHRFTIVNNVIRNNAAYGIQVAAYGCYATSGQCAGPDYSGAVDWVIAYNTIAFQRNRSGIVLWLPDPSYGTPIGTLSNVTIVDNVFYDNDTAKKGAPNGVAFVTFSGDSSILVTRNLFSSHFGDPDLDPNSASVSAKLDADPMFVDPTTFDFHLKPGSPAIDVGEWVTSVDDDFDGVHRPQGKAVDLGAFEWCAAPCIGPGDASVDATADASVDATKDAASDASIDATIDATTDAGVDAGSASGGNDGSSGCSCALPGARVMDDEVALFASIVALAASLAFRRRDRRAVSPRSTTPLDRRARARRRREIRSLAAHR
jgi:hypothetical protein